MGRMESSDEDEEEGGKSLSLVCPKDLLLLLMLILHSLCLIDRRAITVNSNAKVPVLLL